MAGYDETDNLVRLVKWLRSNGVDARSVHTDKSEYDSNPSKYAKKQLESAEYVLIICSAGLEMMLGKKCQQGMFSHDIPLFPYCFIVLSLLLEFILRLKDKEFL